MFSVTLPLVKTTAPIKFESVEPKEGSIKCTPLIPGFYQKIIVFVASKEFHKLARCYKFDYTFAQVLAAISIRANVFFITVTKIC